MPAEHRLGPRPAHDAGCAIVVARDGKIGGHDRAQRGFARKQLDARFLRGEAGGEARGAAGRIAAVRELDVGKELAQIFGWRLGEQPFDARDLDRVDAAAAGRRESIRHRRCAPSRQAARTTSAASVPAKPRQRISATLFRGDCGPADTGSPAHAGSSRSRFATPGTTPRASAASASTVSRIPAAAIVCPIAHLNPVTGGTAAPKRAARSPPRLPKYRIAVCRCRVRDDHADVGGQDARVVQRLGDRAGEAVAVVADCGQPLRLAGIAAAQDLAQHRRAARRCRRHGLEQQRAGALAEQAAVVARVERAQHVGREQPRR